MYVIEKKAEQGDAEEQYNLGEMYFNGKGVTPNDVEAVRWYKLAADQGFAKAQYMLGTMYHEGRGILQYDTEAVRWFKLAAAQGESNAKEALKKWAGKI